MFAVSIAPFLVQDLEKLPDLQPDGWPDIQPHFRYYLQAPFCYPFKLADKETILAIGTYILHGSSAWLGHIIVHKEYRKKGFGATMTQELLKKIDRRLYPTVSLIATVLGEPVYAKLGFHKEMDYCMYRNENPIPFTIDDTFVYDFQPIFLADLLTLDKKIANEDRAHLLKEHLRDGKVYLKEGKILGFYLPTLNEGLLVAEDNAAGIALLKRRLNKLPKIALPETNKEGIRFLEGNGYLLYQKGARMSLGSSIDFKGDGVFGRIGGNLG